MLLRPVLPVLLAAFLATLVLAASVHASPLSGLSPGQLCHQAIESEERSARVPRFLLRSIALAESGRWDDRRRERTAWPWTVMAEGQGRYFPTKADAVAAVRQLQKRGVRNIDVGCMQVNLYYHEDAFPDLETALDPHANVAYAARFLRSLFEDTGSWQKAAGLYHSATPAHGVPYREKVLKLWDQQRQAALGLQPEDRDGLDGSDRTDRPADRRSSPAATVRANPAPVLAGSRPSPLVRGPDRLATAGRRDPRAEAAFAARRMEQIQSWRALRTLVQPAGVIRTGVPR